MYSASFKGNLIVTNLPPDMTGTRLAELFDSFGMVIGAEIRRIPANAGTVTIGVVALAPESAVDAAIDAVNLSMIDDRKVKVGRAKQQPPKPRAAPAARKPAPAPAPPMAAPNRMTLTAASAASFPASEAAPMRKVIVEYKAPKRRVAIS